MEIDTSMGTYTYRDLIRIYATSVGNGASDTDLNPRERRLCMVLLNLASNSARADVAYPPADDVREHVVQYLADILWEARALVIAASPASSDALTNAHERALTVLRNM